MKVYYHSDMDGKASAAVVSLAATYGFTKAMPNFFNTTIDFMALDYGTSLPVEDIGRDEPVWILDYSVDNAVMESILAQTKNVVWIDHHKTAIEKASGRWDDLVGIRSTRAAACVLTWEFMVAKTVLTLRSVPMPIRYVGDRDIWAYELGNASTFFHAGAAMCDTSPDSGFWPTLCGFRGEDLAGHEITGLLRKGELICRYKAQHYADLRQRIGFQAWFEGYKVLAMNICGSGSEAFGTFDDMGVGTFQSEYDCDILMPFYHDGTRFTMSLYSRKGGVDVAVLAKKHGGGGHTNAAGFQCEALPFTGPKPVPLRDLVRRA